VYPFSDAERARVEAMKRDGFVGSADVVAAKLRALGSALALDEVVMLTWASDPAARRRSYELLAKEMGGAA
jgi:alkanesulfonate monooxygenase SsuD/methylene tetrahydromethanopterin reductase-like flavin-dependent oxidoreductase (luciferase family)